MGAILITVVESSHFIMKVIVKDNNYFVCVVFLVGWVWEGEGDPPVMRKTKLGLFTKT